MTEEDGRAAAEPSARTRSAAPWDLRGRLALVTGSTRGIGRAIALGLAECGADIAVHGVHSNEKAQEVVAEARAMGVRAESFRADLSDVASCANLHREIVAAMGDPDILVLNASVQVRKRWCEITAEEAREQVSTNFLSSLELIRLFSPAMTAKGWGRILAIGSVQQVKPHPEMAVYAATKMAQLSLVRNLAAQLAPGGVTVNNLAPGVVLTDRNTEALADSQYAEVVLRKIPVGFFGEASDCVGAALLLCSDAGRYITGVDLLVDGGMSL